MGIAKPTNPSSIVTSKGHNNNNNSSLHPYYFFDKPQNSMSQDYHQGSIFSFSNGFERSSQQDQQQQHIAQQIRRDKLRIQGGFDSQPSLVGIEEEVEETGQLPVYETAGMLSEMFTFPSGGGGPSTATELLENQILHSYRNPRAAPQVVPSDWFSHRQGMTGELGDSNTTINAHDSAAAMQLFLMNPQQHHQQHQQRSPSPSSSSQPVPPQSTSSTLHMLLPNPSPAGAFSQFTWGNHHNNNNPNEIHPGSVVEGQGLSLSLSSSLQHLEASAKAEELRMGEGGMLFFGGGGGSTATATTASAAAQYQFRNNHNHQFHIGSGSNNNNNASSFGTMNMLRNSKYAKPAQELLEEFCSVGRGQFKKNKFKKQNGKYPTNSVVGGGNSSSSSKDIPAVVPPPLSAADRLEHQRRKVKLLSMLDEVDRRYNHYCEQMQMVVNSFDMVMGFGAAVPYTCLAQKAMSRHFRCLKDAIAAQLKHSCELLGDKDAGTSGVTKGETPRLRILEQSLRQQRAFHQMGMMEQEAWRPQRGLPERSVNILRAWLFEHFLHPYPSDADKHLLARQTGLSRNQVSNWFINARVRLWKPMVEDMYQQEAKDEEGTDDNDQQQDRDQSCSTTSAQTPTPNTTTTNSATTATTITHQRSEITAPENDPSFFAINRHQTGSFSDNIQSNNINSNVALPLPTTSQAFPMHESGNADIAGSTLIRFGTNAGDVSLTLGLRHGSGNLPEKNPFSVREFGGC